MASILDFNRRRWHAFGAILGLVYFLAIFGVWVAVFIPILGTPLFLGGLMIWYIPGILFEWTGFFEFHQFGAAPTGWVGHVIMFLLYAAIAVLLSWPFGRDRKQPPAG